MPPEENLPDCVAQNEKANPSGDFVERSRLFWQSRADRPLTYEDARAIIENLNGFFRLLARWADTDQEIVNGQYPSETGPSRP